MRAALRRVVLGLAAWGCAHAQEPARGSSVEIPVFTARAPHAEVIGTDPAVVTNLGLMAEAATSAAGGVLATPPAFSTPVFVRVADVRGRGQPPYAVAVEASGNVTLWLRADAAGEGGSAWRRGLAEAFLTRWAIAEAGVREGRVLPGWLLAGFEARIAAELQPAVGDWLLAQARPAGPAPLGELLTAAPGAVTREQAYVFLRLLVLQPDGQARLTAFVRELLAGAEPRAAFLARYGDLPGLESGAQAFWLAGFFDLTSRRNGPQLSAAASRDAVLDLGRVTVYVDGVERLATPREIWRMRERPPLRALAFARWRTSRAVLLDAHPFYFNVALSAGRAYEALLHHSYTDFRDAWRAYAADLAAGDRMEGEAAAAVAAWDERLRPPP